MHRVQHLRVGLHVDQRVDEVVRDLLGQLGGQHRGLLLHNQDHIGQLHGEGVNVAEEHGPVEVSDCRLINPVENRSRYHPRHDLTKHRTGRQQVGVGLHHLVNDGICNQLANLGLGQRSNCPLRRLVAVDQGVANINRQYPCRAKDYSCHNQNGGECTLPNHPFQSKPLGKDTETPSVTYGFAPRIEPNAAVRDFRRDFRSPGPCHVHRLGETGRPRRSCRSHHCENGPS